MGFNDKIRRMTTIFIVTTLVLLIINNVLRVDFNRFVYVGLYTLLFVLSRKEEIVEMLCFFFPLTFIIPVVPYIFLIAFLILVVKNKFIIQLRSAFIITFFFILELTAHYLYGISDTNRMGGYLLAMGIMFYLIYEDEMLLDYKRCLVLYSYGVLVLCVLYLEDAIIQAPLNWMTMLASGTLRFGGSVNSVFDDMVIELNANSLAYSALTGTTTSIVVLQEFSKFSFMKRIYFIVQTIFVTLVGALTVSRSWLLVMLVILLLLFLSKSNNLNSIIKRIVFALLFFIVIALVLMQGNNVIINAFLNRFTTNDIQTAGGRTDILFDYMNYFFEKTTFVWLGTGVTDYIDVIGMWQSLHMGMQQILICLGIPGAIIFVISVIKPIMFAVHSNVSLVYWLPIISVFLFTQTIQFLNPWPLMLPYVIGVFSLRYGAINKEQLN